MQRRLTATAVALSATAVALSATALIMGISPASATPTDPTIPVIDPAASARGRRTPPRRPRPRTITLPLFGAPLTVDITSGPGGVLASVAVNPADGLTATTLKPNRVVFVNEEGTAKVVVNARGGNQKIEARAGSLAEVSGPGGWSGDLFGTGAITTVGFEIVALADGSPDIANITTSDPTAEIGTVEHESRRRRGWRSGSEGEDPLHRRHAIADAVDQGRGRGRSRRHHSGEGEARALQREGCLAPGGRGRRCPQLERRAL